MLSHCYLHYIFCPLLCSNYPFCVFYYSFCVCFFVLYVSLSILCVLYFRVFDVVSRHVYSYFFSIYVQVYGPWPTVGNPVTINNYHILSLNPES
jgi:hypothetical protein